MDNKMKLRQMIKEAKGKRTMDQFAKDCGRGRNTLFRLSRGEVSERYSSSLIKAIADNAVPEAEVTYTELRRLCDLIVEENQKLKNPMIGVKVRERAEKAEEMIGKVIQEKLLESGLSVKREGENLSYIVDGVEHLDFEMKYMGGKYHFAGRMILEDIGRTLVERSKEKSDNYWHYLVIISDEKIMGRIRNDYEGLNLPLRMSILVVTEEGNIVGEVPLTASQNKINFSD